MLYFTVFDITVITKFEPYTPYFNRGGLFYFIEAPHSFCVFNDTNF